MKTMSTHDGPSQSTAASLVGDTLQNKLPHVGKKSIVIILPGSSYYTLKETYKELGKVYNLILVGHSCPGDGYDRYPPFWATGTSNLNLIDMTTNDEVFNPRTRQAELGIEKQIRKVLQNSDVHCIVCGSRGGQVVIPTLWGLGVNIPSVVLNGGCINSPCISKHPSSRIVLATFGKDYFPTKNPQISINAIYKNQSLKGTILAHFTFQNHRPDDKYFSIVLPYLVDAAINDTTIKLNDIFANSNLAESGFAVRIN